MSSGGFSNRIRARSRRGARLEPPHGWRLGVKTSRAPDGSGSPDPEETPDERARRVEADSRRRGRTSDALDRKDRADLSVGADDQLPGQPLVRRRRGGMEPRNAHHGDPVEDRRTSYGPSTSVWAQDPRAEHLREEARETEWERRLGFEGDSAVASLRNAVVAGTQALVELRWGSLTDSALPSAAEVEYQNSKPRLDDDGSRPHLLNTPQLRDGHYEVVPPLLPSLRAVGCDPGLVKVAAGEYDGARYEPPVLNPVGERQRGSLTELQAAAKGITLPVDEHSVHVQGAALDTLGRAFRDLDAEHLDLCLRDPQASLDVERAWAADRGALLGDVRENALRPEEGRMLVEEMDQYHEAAAPDREAARYQCRVHVAAGRDPIDSPFTGDEARAVDDAAPSLLAGVAAVDPDSPLLLVPPGVDAAVQYEPLLARALDTARAEVLGSPLGSGVPSAAALAVSVASRCASRHEDGARSPFSVGSRPSVAAPDAFDGAADRLSSLANGSYHLDSLYTGSDLRLGSGVSLDSELAAGRLVYDARFEEDCTPDEVADAAHIVARAAGRRLIARSSDQMDPWGVSAEAVLDVFATRMAARVSGLPLDDEYLAGRGQHPPAHGLAVDLGTQVFAAASDYEREVAQAVVRYDDATERLGAIISSLEADGVVVRTDPAAEYDPNFDPVVSREPDGTAVVDLGSSVPLDSPDLLDHSSLVDFHARAYVALGRVTAVASRASDERRASFAALHDQAPSTTDLRVRGADGLVDPVALREQVLVDLFATDQMSAAWGAEGSPIRTVDRGPDGGAKLVVPESQRPKWGPDLDTLVADHGKELRLDGKRLSNWANRVADPAAVAAPPPVVAQAPSVPAAGPAVGQKPVRHSDRG